MVKMWGMTRKLNEIRSCAILGVLTSSTGFLASSSSGDEGLNLEFVDCNCKK